MTDKPDWIADPKTMTTRDLWAVVIEWKRYPDQSFIDACHEQVEGRFKADEDAGGWSLRHRIQSAAPALLSHEGD